jgi:hypothetical protein
MQNQVPEALCMIAKFPVDFRNLGTEVPAATTVHGTRRELCSPSLSLLAGPPISQGGKSFWLHGQILHTAT